VRYLSVCSGIEAATVKKCAKCGETRRLAEFHRQPDRPDGRHSWCRTCANAAQKLSRQKNGRPKAKRRWLLASRYRLTEEQVDTMRAVQGGVCAICRNPMKREVIDHCHKTKAVRGLLCHPCNVKLPAVEDAEFRIAALRYLAS
jgi:hypothetical protein